VSTVFLSYKSEDRPRAEAMVRALEGAGLEVWWDQKLAAGDTWRQQLGERLDAAGCVIVLWTVRSTGPGGNFVQDEAARALRRGSYLPVLLDEAELPLGFGAVQAHPMTGWQGSPRDPRLVALITKVEAQLGRTPSPAPTVSGTTRAGPSRRALLAGGGLVAGAAGLSLLLPGVRARLGLGAPSAAEPVTLAILPFRALTTGEQAELLAEGLTEEIRTALARSGLVQVAARTSSDSFAGSDLGTAEIARRLGVDWLLSGSVRVAESRARVGAALARAESGLETWRDSFDHGIDDLIAMQQAIATSVATALVGKLGPEAAAAAGRVPTTSAPAYGAYLRGRRLLDLATDEQSDRAALAEFDTAIGLDPGFAKAHAARARALQAIANVAATRPEREASVAAALEAARTAVRTDPGDPAAQSTLGFVLMYGLLDFPGARTAFQAAQELAPRDADILVRYGLFHARAGTMATGLEALALATRLDPYNPRAFRAHAFALHAARRHADSLAELRKGLALNPGLNAAQTIIGDNLMAQGKAAEAREAYLRETVDFNRATGLAIAEHRLGNRAAAERAFADLVALGDTMAYQRAQVLAQWSRPDEAMAALALAIRLRDGGVAQMRDDPFLDPLRPRPDFAAALRSLAFA
jgi:TolB-like protein/Tfp pilus assembly protein PilF